METFIITALLVSAGLTTGFPQKLLSKIKQNWGNIGFKLSEQYIKLGKIFGFIKPIKQIYFEKIKVEKSIENLIKVIAHYMALKEECILDLKNSKIDEQLITKIQSNIESIDEKIKVAKNSLIEQKNSIKEINKFILELESDTILYNIEKTNDEETNFLKNKADIDIMRNRKNVE